MDTLSKHIKDVLSILLSVLPSPIATEPHCSKGKSTKPVRHSSTAHHTISMWFLLPFLLNRRKMDKGSNAQGTKSPPRFLDVVKIIVGGAATIVGLVTVLMITIGSASFLEKGKYYYFTLGTASASAPLGILTALFPRVYFLFMFVFGPMFLLWMIHFGVYAASYLNTEDPNIIGLGLMKAVLWVSVANAILWFILAVANFIAWWKYSKKGKGGSTNEGTSEPPAPYPIDLHTLAGGHNPGGYYTGPNTYYLPTSGQR